MPTEIGINIEDHVSKTVLLLVSAISDTDRLYAFIGPRAENLTRDYLREQAGFRHATAERLGATPTGFLAKASNAVTSETMSDGVMMHIGSPGLNRAFSDVTIVPTTKQWLTIPVHPAAYGHRAGEFSLVAIRQLDHLLLVKKDPGQKFGEIYYILTKRVVQHQDRSLLPSDEAYLYAAMEGINDYMDYTATHSLS